MNKSHASSDEQFVQRIFQLLLKRDPEQAAVDHYSAGLQSGRTHVEVIEELCRSDEYAFKKGAPLYVTPGHFYSPIVDPAEARAALERAHIDIPATIPGIALDREGMIAVWQRLLPFFRAQIFHEHKAQGFRYAFENPAFSWGDGLTLHAMLRLFSPKKIIEIGSGWSSACMVDTVERCFEQECSLTFIDPNPQLVRNLIGENAQSLSVSIIGSGVQSIDVATFRKLEAGDFLFIDSTHLMKTGSDVNFELFEILPEIKPGVLVHIHDMFWPFEYPSDWTLTENRSWNEIYAIRALLTDSHSWKILFFNDYFAKLERARIHIDYPDFLKNAGGSLWLQKI